MAKVQLEIDIACRPDEAFDLWADMRNDARWNPICVVAVLESENATGIGARFRGTYKGFGEVVEEVTSWERPLRCARSGTAGPFGVSNDIRFLPGPNGGTRLQFSGEVVPSGLAVIMTPFMGPMMKRQATKTVNAFKAALESGVRPA